MGDLSPLSHNEPGHTRQYMTALAATMGALSMGTILGYSSPASVQLAGVNNTICLKNDTCLSYSNGSHCTLIKDEGLTYLELSWFSSCVNLAAIFGSLLTGVLINKIGRRNTMMVSILPFTIGWVLIGL